MYINLSISDNHVVIKSEMHTKRMSLSSIKCDVISGFEFIFLFYIYIFFLFFSHFFYISDFFFFIIVSFKVKYLFIVFAEIEFA